MSDPTSPKGISVAISAGAGCGKTTVLTKRFMSAATDDGLALSSMVALTFTDKAAAELRGRVRKECRARFDSADPSDRPLWKKLLRGLDAAPIGTFHSFCTSLLRKYAILAGIDPDFQVFSAAIASTIREEAVARETRRGLAEENPDLIALAVEFGLDRVRKSIDSLVGYRDGSELAGWALKTPEQIVENWRDVWIRKVKATTVRPLLDRGEECRLWWLQSDFENVKLAALRVDLTTSLLDLPKRIDDSDWLAGLRELSTIPKGLQKKHWPSPEMNEAAKRSLESLRKAIDRWNQASQWGEAVSLKSADDGLKFVRLALGARQAYRLAKREAGGLDFDDLIVLARDLLRDHLSEIQVDADQEVGLLLVDEFQDTDRVQAEILRSLAGVEFAEGKLFLVGDFKQSIYRFRGAEPTLFHQFRHDFPEEGRLTLQTNYRSSVGIIEFVNALFEGAFSEAEEHLLPHQGASRPPGPFPVEFLWANEPGDDPEERTAAYDDRKVEAKWLAKRIKAGLTAGWEVMDRETSKIRNAHAGDVAFLFRTLNDIAAYENALAREGLDYYLVGGKAFYNQQEVQDLINVLSWIEDPHDGPALAATLRSPFFGVSDEGLFWLGTSLEKDLRQNLTQWKELQQLSETDRERIERADRLLACWRGEKDRVSIADLLDRILDESGYEAALLAEFLGDRKRANARKLVRLARTFDDQVGFTLAQFVARLRADQKNPPSEGEAGTANESGEAIRLMTIHQSKGLEFPIVVVPDLNRSRQTTTGLVEYRSELGPVVRPGLILEPEPFESDEASESEQSLGSILLKALEDKDESEEAIRLFYVAATRARDHLILSAPFDLAAGKPPRSEALRLLASKFDLNSGLSLFDTSPIQVQVTFSCPIVEALGLRRKSKTPLRAMARLITQARVQDLPISIPRRNRPRWLDLDLLRNLEASDRKRDRLIRSILTDTQAFEPGMLDSRASLAGARMVPRIEGNLIPEVVDLIAPWSEGAVKNLLDSALRVERNLRWTYSWPTDVKRTTLSGWTDFLLRDEEGDWTILNFSMPGASEPIERLRLKLGARVVPELGMGPVAGGWRIRLGVLEPAEEDRNFGDGEIEALLDELF